MELLRLLLLLILAVRLLSVRLDDGEAETYGAADRTLGWGTGNSGTESGIGDADEDLALAQLDRIYDGHADDVFYFLMQGRDDSSKARKAIMAASGGTGGETSSSETGSEPDASLYGEVLPKTAADMLRSVGAKPGQRFYDLGSGNGKLVVLAYLLGLDATGVELADQRWDNACSILRHVSNTTHVAHGQGGSMRFLKASFLDVDFSDADIVFTDSVEFPDSLMEGLAKTARRMKAGAKIISYLGLPGPGFRDLETITGKASWKDGAHWLLQEVEAGGHPRESPLQSSPSSGSAASLLVSNGSEAYGSQVQAGEAACVL